MFGPLSGLEVAATTLAERVDKKSTENTPKKRLIDTVKPPGVDLGQSTAVCISNGCNPLPKLASN
jgi:hypothetical protein